MDDFNSPILIAHLFEAVKWIFQVKNGEEKISIDELHELKTLMNAFVFDVLGLRNEEQAAGNNDKLDGVVQHPYQYENGGSAPTKTGRFRTKSEMNYPQSASS